MMMSTSDLLIMIGCALAAGVGMTMIGVLIEFSLRKKVLPAQRPAAEVPEAAPPTAAPGRLPEAVAPEPLPLPAAQAPPEPEEEQPPLAAAPPVAAPVPPPPAPPPAAAQPTWSRLPRNPSRNQPRHPPSPASGSACARPARISWDGCGP